MRRIEMVLGYLTALLFIVMIVLVTIQVGNRFVVRQPMPWTEELTRIAYVGLIFVGSVYAAMRSEHIRVNSLFDLLPGPVRRGMHIVFGLASAGFMGVVAYGAFIYARIGWTASLPTVSWITMGYVMALIAVCALAMSIAFLVWAIRAPTPPRQPLVEQI